MDGTHIPDSIYVVASVVVFLVSFALSAALVPLIRRASVRVGFVDHPDPRKVHRAPMPLGGGIAIFIGATLPPLAGIIAAALIRAHGAAPWGLPEVVYPLAGGVMRVAGKIGLILAGGLVLHVMGLLDDRYKLPASLRLIVQMAVALGLWFGGFRILAFFGSGLLSAVLTVLWIAVMTNAFNFLDNMDGLSAGVTLVCSAIFLAVTASAGRLFESVMLLCLMGAVAGFLLYNFPPAKIFMGDGGSNFIGYMLGVLTTVLTFYEKGSPLFRVLAPLIILALPLYDFTSVVLIRLASGQSPFKPDKRHFSHRLAALGLTTRQTVLTIYLVTFALGLSATFLYAVDTLGAVIIGVQVLAIIAVIWILERAGRRREEGSGVGGQGSGREEKK